MSHLGPVRYGSACWPTLIVQVIEVIFAQPPLLFVDNLVVIVIVLVLAVNYDSMSLVLEGGKV